MPFLLVPAILVLEIEMTDPREMPDEMCQVRKETLQQVVRLLENLSGHRDDDLDGDHIGEISLALLYELWTLIPPSTSDGT